MFTEPSPLTLVARTAISSLLMLGADEPVAAETLAFAISFCESFARLFRVAARLTKSTAQGWHTETVDL